MAEYIEKNVAIARLTRLEVTDANATMADAKRVLADMPCAEAVSLHDIYRVIAGHSYYHGDRILSALKCIVEGKEVNPVCPTDMAPVVHGRWIYESNSHAWVCSQCGRGTNHNPEGVDLYCYHCGAKMDERE